MRRRKMKTSERGLSLIKEFEGFSPVIYLCPAGKPTIGHGHVVRDETFVQPISEHEAENLLLADLSDRYEPAVLKLIDAEITQGQFDALVSFVYNLGASNLERSTLRKKLNAGDYNGAAEEFERWTLCNGKPLAGLIRRRQAERSLFERH